MQGNKTHDLQVKIIERKEGVAPRPENRDDDAHPRRREVKPSTGPTDKDSGAFPDLSVTHKESGHDKHNHGGQEGHKRQKHSPAEEGS